MTLRYFLLHKTLPLELCAICEGGWVVATVWIDHEDLFHIPPNLADREVKGDKWDYIPVVNRHNACIKIPCHYIDI